MKTSNRSDRGNMLVLAICLGAVIFIPSFMVLSYFMPQILYGGRAKNVVEAAVKVAATDLSRIVINDPAFGYVSLSNHPAIGKATVAADDEPLAVTGINTLVGTLRQNAIIAEELNNDAMRSLVAQDTAYLGGTIIAMNATLSGALAGNSRTRCTDMHGAVISPRESVEKFLRENLPRNVELESFDLAIGWLDGGSSTTIPLPQPRELAYVPSSQSPNYEAFKTYPIGDHSFSFAGLDTQTHLVAARNFKGLDNRKICSIVKLECTVVTKGEAPIRNQFVVCCQPYSKPDTANSGAMTVRFAGRPVLGLSSWNELLSRSSFMDNKVTTFDVVNGDYPLERRARIQEDRRHASVGTADQFASHMYYWLRNGRLRPNIDAVLAMINEPFQPYANQIYIYEFADKGAITRRNLDGGRFPRSVAADGQHATIADTKVRSGANAIVFFKNSVRYLTADRGKHGGQPLAGYPLNNVDQWIDYERMASEFSKRKDYNYSLALDIEIGGTRESTAKDDVISMRMRTRSRKI